MGEATRISLRSNCLNSKAGYNRSGISRLTLKPEDEPDDGQGKASRRIEIDEKEGMETLVQKVQERAKMAGKRKSDDQEIVGKPNKRRKKLKHSLIDANWGLEAGELEGSRVKFLQSSPVQCTMTETTETNKLDKKDPEVVEEKRSPVKDLIVLVDVKNEIKKHCSDWPKPVPKSGKRWGKLKSGLFGWVVNTPDKKKTAKSGTILSIPGMTQKTKNKKLPEIKTSGVKAWCKSVPETRSIITAEKKNK